ncbi:MAG: T9SS type A sorting domain-containing protein [Saprospiraceae bacterium]
MGCNPEKIPGFDSTRVKVSDHCDGTIRFRLLNTVDRQNGCNYRRVYRYAVYDECKNRTVCRQTYAWIQDTTPPVVAGCDSTVDLGCNPEVIPEPNPARLHPFDECGPVHTESFPGDIVVVDCQYSLTYTYLFTDGCGNTTKCFEHFVWVVDNEPPTIENCVDGGISIDLGCIRDTSELPPGLPAPLIITDDCGVIDVEVLAEVYQLEDCCGVLIRRYGVMDGCGNQSFCSVQWHFCSDSLPPEVVCPDSTYLGCNPDTILQPDFSRIKVADNCRIVDSAFAYVDYQPDGCHYQLGYLYSFIDACGNVSQCEEKFAWTIDHQPPAILNCQDGGLVINLECIKDTSELPEAFPAPLIIEDDCGQVDVDVLAEVLQTDSCCGVLTRRYGVTDACGNQSFCSVQWEFCLAQDLEIICPEPVDVGCIETPSQLPSPDPERVKVASSCSDVDVEFLDAVREPNDCGGIIYYRYVATDHCGHSDTCREVFRYIRDTEPPTVICPEPVDFGCVDPGFSPPPPDTSRLVYQDNCGIAKVNTPPVDIVVVNCTYHLTWVYEFIDYCGNKSTCFETFSWTMDTIPPEIKCPEPGQLGCIQSLEQLPLPDTSRIKAEDFCGPVRIVLADSSLEIDDCDGKLVYTYQAYDGCQNRSQCVEVFYFRFDTIPPKVVCEDLDLGCNPDSIPAISLDDIQWEDNCGDVELVNAISAIGFEGCRYFISQAFTIQDACGNTSHCAREITYVIDSIAPVLLCHDLDLGCNPDSIPDISSIGIIDDCDSVRIREAASSIRMEGCTTIITQSLIAEDACGNSSSCSREIRYVQDTVPPDILSCPDSTFLGCNPASIPGPDFGRVKVSDNCGVQDSLLAYVDFIPDGCHYQVGYLYIFFDSCGNRSDCLEKFAWTVDSLPPVFHTDYCDALARGLDFGCTPNGDELLKIYIDSIIQSVVDDCDDVDVGVNISDRVVDGCEVRLYLKVTAMDGCGNTAICAGSVRWTIVNPDVPRYEFPSDTIITNCIVPDPPKFDNDNCGPCRMELIWSTTIGDCSSGRCTIYRLWVRQCCRQTPESHFQVIQMNCQINTMAEPEGIPETPALNAPEETFIPLPEDLNSDRPEHSSQEVLARIGELTLHPNPAVHELNVQLTGLADAKDLELRVYDDFGTVHWSKKFGKVSEIHTLIDVQDLSSGTYSIVVSDGTHIWYKRFIKIE